MTAFGVIVRVRTTDPDALARYREKAPLAVHGALADGSGWKPVVDVLTNDGYNDLLDAAPGRSGTARFSVSRLVRFGAAPNSACTRS
jgi:hypothetical protein